MNRYSILPFNGPRFHENQDRLKTGEQPCAICGRKVAQPFKYSAVVVGGGDWARTPEEAADESDSGYMGEWGIGTDCHNKYLIRELLYCWVSNCLSVLVPKSRGEGYLKTPYGHHNDAGLNKVADIAGCDIFGLDGALDFQCPGSIFHGNETARKEFAAKVMPALEKHYGFQSREIDSDEYWKRNPLHPKD